MATLFGGDRLLDSSDKIDGLCLLIIDPQNDFHKGGPLEVPGAEDDCARTTEFLQKHSAAIKTLVITLDSHHVDHIAHSSFWEKPDDPAARPSPFTTITAAELESGLWRARDPALRAWSIEYAKKLEAAGRFKLFIWPEHCLVGTEGQAVRAPLQAAALQWARDTGRTITWLLKGTNNLTEMYSCFSAEVPLDADPTTSLNKPLIAGLARHDKVICCGQAKSHCVNYSVRDLLAAWPADKPKADVVLLGDATSPVAGFECSAADFEADLKAAGGTVTTTAAFAG